jgi:hypothetical protein
VRRAAAELVDDDEDAVRSAARWVVERGG